ncbi:MAG: hypothetical protein Q7J85_08725, partial [Bacillota bacterium]|nr:hypothetical protein [Bacillota bacterium]
MADPKNFTWEPPDKNISIANARGLFLEAIEAIAPEVIEWLREKAFPYFKINYKEISDSYSLDVKIKTFTEKLGPRVLLAKHINDLLSWSSYEVATEDIYPDLLPLKKRIDEWIDKYFLHSEDDWIQRQSLETMYLWAMYGDIDDIDNIRNEWVSSPGWDCWPHQKSLIIELPKLYNTEMTRPQMQKAFESLCKKKIIEYLDDLEADRKVQGWEKRHKKIETERFKWLVYSQIKGLSHRDIAKEVIGLKPGNTEKTRSAFESARRMIGKGIATAKKECGIILRQAASPGRKRKT